MCPKPKKISRRGVSTGLPTQAKHQHHVWTWDFIFDRTDKGGTLKMMTLLDENARQCLTIRVERQVTSAYVSEVLEKAMALSTGNNNYWDWYEGVWTFAVRYFNDHANGGSYRILSIANQ